MNSMDKLFIYLKAITFAKSLIVLIIEITCLVLVSIAKIGWDDKIIYIMLILMTFIGIEFYYGHLEYDFCELDKMR